MAIDGIFNWGRSTLLPARAGLRGWPSVSRTARHAGPERDKLAAKEFRMTDSPAPPDMVARALATLPEPQARVLHALRSLILRTADRTAGVGPAAG